jgi:pimeloyl-ACP methyl ester carboxylesterase
MAQLTYKGSDGCALYATLIENRSAKANSDSAVVLLHGGGPDHHSLIQLAERLADRYAVVLPDIRGYGQSVCTDPSRHTWSRYANDIITLLNHLGVERAVIGGAGIGTTISLRAAVAYPSRVKALVLISVEDIEDDEAKAAEIQFMDDFAARARNEGIEAAWAPILPGLAPIIETMVRDAIPRSNAASIAAAAHIGRDRSFRKVEELAVITVPTLVIPGMDHRHPVALAEAIAKVLPQGHLAPITISTDIRTLEEFGDAFAPVIREFLDKQVI